MKMMPVRIDAFVFAPFPIKNGGSNTAIENQIFNPLIASLGAFANLINNRVGFFLVSLEISVNI